MTATGWRLIPDKRDREADKRDLASARDVAAASRDQDAGKRDAMAALRDKTARLRDRTMRERLYAADQRDQAAQTRQAWAGAREISRTLRDAYGRVLGAQDLARFPGRDVEQRHVEILTTVKAVVRVPVAVKLSPYYSSTGEMALRLDRAGADGVVLFNRFLQPDIDPETLTVTAGFGLSSPAEARLPRAWIALLAGRVAASLAATTGVEDASDVARYLLAGADVVMTASALIRHGTGHAAVLLDGLSAWMSRKGFAAVSDVRGLLRVPADADGAAYERAGYVRELQAANRGHGPW